MTLLEFIADLIGVPAEQIKMKLEQIKLAAPDFANDIDQLLAAMIEPLSTAALGGVLAKLPDAIRRTLKGDLDPGDSPSNLA